MAKENMVSFSYGGQRVDVDLYDIDGLEWRDATRATGLRPRQLMDLALLDRDFEAVAALVWIRRRRDEPSLTYDNVLKGFSFAAVAEGGPSEEEQPPGPPEPGPPSPESGPDSPNASA